MAANYLQYIGSVYPPEQVSKLRFLVSGADARVRRVVGQNIAASCYGRQKTLFLLDYTQGAADLRGNLGGYRVVDMPGGQVCLCGSLLEVESLKGVSRLRSLLSALGFSQTQAMKVISYLSFVQETERRLGNTAPLSFSVLEEYGGVMLVERKLGQLAARGAISQENYEYLLSRYGEISGAAADFELFFVLLAPFLDGTPPAQDMAVRLPVREFGSDQPVQALMCELTLSYLRQNSEHSALLVLDDGRGDHGFLLPLLKNLPAATEVHMLSRDVFSLGETELGILMNTFTARIYSRHEDMASCGKIEARCGQIDVVKRASSVSVDRHFRASSAWDMLFGTNRTETEIQNAPSKESRFRKELIRSLSPGYAIVDCGGAPVLFSF